MQPDVTGLLMVGKRMNILRTIAVLGATTVLMTACGGGGSRVAPVGTPESDSSTGRLTLSAAFGAVAIAASGKQRLPASGVRRPSFITPGLQSVALYDSTTLVWVANVDLAATQQFTTVYANPNPRYSVTPGGCTNNSTTETCQLQVDAKPGPHTFDLIAYPVAQTATPGGGPPVFIGVISSEGEVSAQIHPHDVVNASLVMLGVASGASLSGSADEAAFGQTVQYSYEILDSTPLQILTPGAYDNGPVTISVVPSNVATVTPPTSFASPASSPGPQTFSVTCDNPNGGAASVVLQANAQPNTAYASGLSYSTVNYSSGILASAVLVCDATPATLPITVQSRKRAL
jgi:hypothetical protein